ncbi:MAG: hypothetical protein ACR2RB_17850 [Gammaproteobacteria bacterium]
MASVVKSESPAAYSMDVFIRLLKSLPSNRIRQLPLDRLPPEIPQGIINEVPVSSRGAVEELLLAANVFQLKRRREDLDRYGDDIVAALDAANRPGKSANVKVFENKILMIVQMLREAQEQGQAISTDLLESNVLHINRLLIDIRSENAGILRDKSLIERGEPIDLEDERRFQKAAKRLESRATTLGKALTEYYVLRLKILARAIFDKHKEVTKNKAAEATLMDEIIELRGRLESSQALWRRALNKEKTKQDYEKLQSRITGLAKELSTIEVVIAEKDLTAWLDAIVDASLNPQSVIRAERLIGAARASLYVLLQKFCLSQENSALQIAQNPFLQIDAEQAIRFMLRSEQFILEYFANKKKDDSALLSGAARVKIEDLDRLEREILDELKRSTKLHRQKIQS